MSWYSRIRGRISGRSARGRGAERERRGDLPGAVEGYIKDGQPDEAARVLLLRADTESAAGRRLAFCEQAARTAKEPALLRRAQARSAMLKLDILRSGGGALPGELTAIAKELLSADEHDAAAEAFALAGDSEGEVGALAAAGEVDRLESRLSDRQDAERHDRAQHEVIARMRHLDQTAERSLAIGVALEWLKDRNDPRVEDELKLLRARLVQRPDVRLAVRGERASYLFGEAVIIGRSEATMVVESRAVSRHHLRIFRRDGQPMVEDLQTRNGTYLQGARLSAPIPIGSGLSLKLGGEVPCSLGTQLLEGQHLVEIQCAGRCARAALGELRIDGWTLSLERERSAEVLRLRSKAGMGPFLGNYRLAPVVELAVGDALSKVRGGIPMLEVVSGEGG